MSAVGEGKLEGIWVTLYIFCEMERTKLYIGFGAGSYWYNTEKRLIPPAVSWGRLFT